MVAAAFVVHTRALRAQAMLDVMTADTSAAIGESLPSSRRNTCIANVATTSLHRVPVFLSAWMMNRADSAFAAQADLLAQDVAAALRAELGGSDSTVTDEDGHLVWYAVPTSIVVTAHRNGDMSAHRLVVDGDSTAAPLLLRAFDAARAHGGAAMMWPDQVEKDSVFARIDLWPRYAHAKSEPESLGRLGHHFPVFTLTEPEEDPALPLKNTPPPRYPPQNEREHYAGWILMQFAVDTTGHAMPATIHDRWPAGKPRLDGYDGAAYDAFVATLTTWLLTVRFQPAHLGSCLHRQLVQWPFEFKIPGAR